MDALRQDLRYGVRALLRTPGFTLVAVLTLALGIGANTAIFSVVNAVLFRPLPVEGLDRLHVVRADLPGLGLNDAPLSPAEVVDLSARTDLFQAVTGFRPGDRTLTGRGEPARLVTAATLGDFAAVFGVQPHLGRFYTPEHSTGGPREVAVVSYGLWQQLSGGDPAFVGQTIQLNDVAHEVVGVMPPDFRYPREVQVWTPFAFTERWQTPQARNSLFMTTVARLRPGVSDEQLAGQLGTEAARWTEEHSPGAQFGKELHSTRFVEYLAGPLRLVLLVLMGAVVFVLMIAAANVASLQLVRATGRGREMAVRAAIGAGRRRIAGQLLVENALLALLGGVAGLWLGVLALQLLERWEPAQQLYLSGIRLDTVVLGFTALVALLAAVAFGTVPALRASRVEPQQVLRESARGSTPGSGRHRLLKASVLVQVALALVLLLGSGLMIRTLSRLLASDPGFRPENLTTAQISLGGSNYSSPERRVHFFDAALERIRVLPGMQSAALVWGLPFTDQNDSSPFDIVGRPAAEGEPERHAEARVVSAGYFSTMGIPLLRGSDFDGGEELGSPVVAVIDETFAAQFFPGEDPIGSQIEGYAGEPATIIAVVGRVDHEEIGDAPKAVAYYSYRQLPWSGWRSLVVRSTQPPEAVAAMLQSAVAEIDPNVALYDLRTMDARIERSLAPRRLAMLALGGFAALSLLLATLGVYGVMRYTTNQRVHEIGIRMAVGAEPRHVVGMVIRQGMLLTALGLLVGVVGALWLTRLMSGILFAVSPHDPAVFLGATLFLAAVALLASYLPARRAARVDPMVALRSD
jgi:putative ABC transport system permease protein